MASTQSAPSLALKPAGLRISLLPDADNQSFDAADLLPINGSAHGEIPAIDSPHQPLSQTIPVHPITSLQHAFTESLDEATNGSSTPKPRLNELDSHSRREKLLAQPRDAEPFDAPWRYRPGQKQHELSKLIAQISFGVYLLLNGMANSTPQVVSILQGHIDEVDEFLEVSFADLAEANKDLERRIEHLTLPLSNTKVFEELLEDRSFRNEILDGNDKIDHVLARTKASIKQWSADTEAGLQATGAFTKWLASQQDADWRTHRPDVVEIFEAMRGNADGWLATFDEVNDRIRTTTSLIARLATIIAEMERKAGEVSRRTWESIPPFSTPSTASPTPRGSRSAAGNGVTTSKESHSKSSHRRQLSSLSTSELATPSAAADEGDTDSTNENPSQDGGLSPRPPHSPAARHAASASGSADSRKAKKQPQPIKLPQEPDPEAEAREADNRYSLSDEPLYVLQPRTYTPQAPEPLPSPMLRDAANRASQNAGDSAGEVDRLPRKRGSIRQRVSDKKTATLPDDILIPPRSLSDTPIYGPSPKFATPRTANSQALDSAYGSDSEARSRRKTSKVVSESGVPRSSRPQQDVRSPRSDQSQYYRPVLASPHSPLQQRPQTAVEAAGASPSPSQPNRDQRKPSTGGDGLSVPTKPRKATIDDGNIGSHTATADKNARKKKSAFGWFKKAFSLDEAERAEFEARKAMARPGAYYEFYSPRYVEGRQVR